MIITGFAHLLIISGWCKVGYSTLPCCCWSPESEPMLCWQNENAMLPPTTAIAGGSGEKGSSLTCSASPCYRRTCFASVLPDFEFLVNKNQGHCNKRSKHGKLTVKLPIKIIETYTPSANKLSTA